MKGSLSNQIVQLCLLVVLLRVKTTLSGLSVRMSCHPESWSDTMTEVLSFSLSEFPGLTLRLDCFRFFGPVQ